MEAKDTVVLEPEDSLIGKFQKERTDAISEMFDNKDEHGIYPTTQFFSRLDSQAREIAEISFKAGQKSMGEPWDREQTVFADGKKAGQREVVEWMKSKMMLERCDPDVMAYFNDYVWIDYQEWQAKLKEWGIME